MMRRILIITSIFALVMMFPITAFAHSSSQASQLASSQVYDEDYNVFRTYLGTERGGWLIDENAHSNGNIISYSFSDDPQLTNTIKGYVRAGASTWSGTVSIVERTDGTGTGSVNTMNNPNSNKMAIFIYYSNHIDVNGHFTAWNISINLAKSQNARVSAHEFGHAIGLKDLYSEINTDKLMYGYADGASATGPTDSDRWGAKVITGAPSRTNENAASG